MSSLLLRYLPNVLFVLIEEFVRWEVGGRIAIVLWDAGKKQTIYRRNYDRCSLRRWSTSSRKYSCLNSIQPRAAWGIGFYVNPHKTKFMCFKQERAISILIGKPQKLVEKFSSLGRNISSTESDINICIVKVWTAIDKLSIITISDLSNKIKHFFQTVAV